MERVGEQLYLLTCTKWGSVSGAVRRSGDRVREHLYLIQRIVCLVDGRTDKTSQLALTRAWRRSRRPRKGDGKPLPLCQAAASAHVHEDADDKCNKLAEFNCTKQCFLPNWFENTCQRIGSRGTCHDSNIEPIVISHAFSNSLSD